MIDLRIFTKKSKKSIIKALRMTEECGFKYLEPQVLMAGIVNEGRDMLSYVLQFMHINKIDFCKKINNEIVNIKELSHEKPILRENTNTILEKAHLISLEKECELISL